MMSPDPKKDANKGNELSEEQLEQAAGGRTPIHRLGKEAGASGVPDDVLERVSGGRPPADSLKTRNHEAIPLEPPDDRPPTH